MVEFRVLLRDRTTGQEAWHSYEVEPRYADNQEFWWIDGNASCDCNRLIFLHRELGICDEEDIGGEAYPCGDERVVLVTVLRDGVEQYWRDR